MNLLISKLFKFNDRFTSDYNKRINELENNPTFGEYWRAIQNVTESLLNIANDIYLMQRHERMMQDIMIRATKKEIPEETPEETSEEKSEGSSEDNS